MAVPESFHSVTPYLCVDDTRAAIEFYSAAFGAAPRGEIMADDNGKVGHAEVLIGDSPVMLNDEYPEMDVVSPTTLGGSATTMHLYVDDADATFAQATAAGAKELLPVEDRFYGDRSGRVIDPFGHHWIISTHVEDVQPDELAERAKAYYEESEA